MEKNIKIEKIAFSLNFDSRLLAKKDTQKYQNASSKVDQLRKGYLFISISTQFQQLPTQIQYYKFVVESMAFNRKFTVESSIKFYH